MNSWSIGRLYERLRRRRFAWTIEALAGCMNSRRKRSLHSRDLFARKQLDAKGAANFCKLSFCDLLLCVGQVTPIDSGYAPMHRNSGVDPFNAHTFSSCVLACVRAYVHLHSWVRACLRWVAVCKSDVHTDVCSVYIGVRNVHDEVCEYENARCHCRCMRRTCRLMQCIHRSVMWWILFRQTNSLFFLAQLSPLYLGQAWSRDSGHICTCIFTHLLCDSFSLQVSVFGWWLTTHFWVQLDHTIITRRAKAESRVLSSFLHYHDKTSFQAKLDQAILWLFRGIPLILHKEEDD